MMPTTPMLACICLMLVGLACGMPQYRGYTSYQTRPMSRQQEYYYDNWPRSRGSYINRGNNPRNGPSGSPVQSQQYYYGGGNPARNINLPETSYGDYGINRLYDAIDERTQIGLQQQGDDADSDWQNQSGEDMSQLNYNQMLSEMAAMRVAAEERSNNQLSRHRTLNYEDEDDDPFYMNNPRGNPLVIQKELLDNEILDKIFDGEDDLTFRTSASPPAVQDKVGDRNQMLHRIGMRLVDLTDSEDTTDVPDADEVNDSAEIEEVTTTAASEKSPAMSMEKAKALLKQLQVEEAARGKSQQKRTSVDKGELSEMFGTVEKDPKPRREGSASITREAVMKEDALDGDINDEDADTDDADTDDKVDEADMKNIMKEDKVKDSLRNTEIDLLKDENELLIKAIESVVNTPIELVESSSELDYMRSLVKEAAIRQNAVDFIAQKLEKLKK